MPVNKKSIENVSVHFVSSQMKLDLHVSVVDYFFLQQINAIFDLPMPNCMFTVSKHRTFAALMFFCGILVIFC